MWMVIKDPSMRKEVRDTESCEVVKKWNFTTRIVAITLDSVNDKGRKQAANLAARKSGH